MHQVPSTTLRSPPVDLDSTAADELVAVLHGVHCKLIEVTDRLQRPAGATTDLDAVADLSHYLIGELNPVLNALALRVYPPLRRLGVIGPGQRAATEQARLLRLTERLTTIRVEQASAEEVDDLVDEIASLTNGLLLRALRTLPVLLDGLGRPEAAHIVEAAQRTISAGRHLPHLELQPALL